MTAYLAHINARVTYWLMGSRLVNWLKCPNCSERFIRASTRDAHTLTMHTMPLARMLGPGFIRLSQAIRDYTPSFADIARNLSSSDERRAVEEAERLIRGEQL